MGIANAGFEQEYSIEIDKHCCSTILKNLDIGSLQSENWDLINGDISSFNFTNISKKIDLVSGGPPCQPFSLGGKHQAFFDKRDMFPHAIRAIAQIKPKAFIFENVKGLTRDKFSNYFEYIKLQLSYPELEAKENEEWLSHLKRLEEYHVSGFEKGVYYNVVARVVNAADYGVPQKRERVFIIGFRGDLNIKWSFPDGTHSKEALMWAQVYGDYWERFQVPKMQRTFPFKSEKVLNKLTSEPHSKPWVTVRDALFDLPSPKTNNSFSGHVFKPGARSYPGHTGSPLDEPSKTLKAGRHGVPGGENMIRFSDGSVRYFTIRECARLQCFPDNFIFNSSWSQSVRQIGNAVPIKLAQVLAESIYKALER